MIGWRERFPNSMESENDPAFLFCRIFLRKPVATVVIVVIVVVPRPAEGEDTATKAEEAMVVPIEIVVVIAPCEAVARIGGESVWPVGRRKVACRAKIGWAGTAWA